MITPCKTLFCVAGDIKGTSRRVLVRLVGSDHHGELHRDAAEGAPGQGHSVSPPRSLRPGRHSPWHVPVSTHTCVNLYPLMSYSINHLFREVASCTEAPLVLGKFGKFTSSFEFQKTQMFEFIKLDSDLMIC